MDSLLIKGGTPLHGEVTISGAKNAVLPIMAATLLTDEPCVIHRVPQLSDVTFMGQILSSLGARVQFEGDTVTVQAASIFGVGDYDLIRKMRGSICILGPLLARLHKARVSMPGGCVIGSRPIDLHLKGLQALGAKVGVQSGYVIVSASKLSGSELFLGGRAGPTVLGTANVMMAAVLADGVTIIESAACEPEVMDLANFLNAMGAKITGAGSPTITIMGVKRLHGAEHEVIPDRIEAATFAIAAAVTNGEIKILGARPDHMHAVLDKLREAGVKVERNGPALTVRRGGRLKPVDITTLPYAGFPTDVQAQMTVLMALTSGISIITERIFESRFMHVSELARLGADIAIEGPSAIVRGGKPLSGAPIMASDLRASAALVLAGLVAKGKTLVKRIYHLDRGYENIDEKLRKLGARVQRVQNMKALISLFILLVAFWIGKKLFLTYRDIEKHPSSSESASAPQQTSPAAAALPGLPASLEASLNAAEKQGAAGLRDWLRSYRTFARDPRLAAIELDYVVLISHQDPAEARRIFNEVKDRTPTFSPIYDRVKRLEKTFQ